MSRQVFAFTLGVNPRTLERWEHTLERLEAALLEVLLHKPEER